MASKLLKTSGEKKKASGEKKRTSGEKKETSGEKKKMAEIKELKDLVDWFEAKHETEDRVEFKIYKKHTGYPVPTHNQQVRTAIRYGWIDTKVKRIDEDSFMRVFVKRKDTANWSENTLRYASELTAQGMMKPLGRKHYLRALELNKK